MTGFNLSFHADCFAACELHVMRYSLTDFFFKPPDFQIPTLQEIGADWQYIPDPQIRSMVSVECQYLSFHLFLLESLHYHWGKSETVWKESKIDLSVRAGAVKAAILLFASIAEAVLRAHAEKRGYNLPAKEHQRTFGTVLNAWEEAGKAEAKVIWEDLNELRDHRNLVHLYAAAEKSKDWRTVLEAEEGLVSSGLRVIEFLKHLKSC